MTWSRSAACREPAHALAAAEAGADFIGLVFAESRRRVTVEQARAVVCTLGEPVLPTDGGAGHVEALLRRKRPLVVGVFAGADTETVNHTAERGGPRPGAAQRRQPWECVTRSRCRS